MRLLGSAALQRQHILIKAPYFICNITIHILPKCKAKWQLVEELGATLSSSLTRASTWRELRLMNVTGRMFCCLNLKLSLTIAWVQKLLALFMHLGYQSVTFANETLAAIAYYMLHVHWLYYIYIYI